LQHAHRGCALLGDWGGRAADRVNNRQLPVSFSTVYLRFLYSH